MPSTIRQQKIVDFLVAALTNIHVSGGYYTEIGANASAWKAVPLDPNEQLPAAILRDLECPAISESVSVPNRIQWALHVQIEIRCKAGADGADMLIRKCIADVYKAVGVDPQCGGEALNVYVKNHTILVEQNTRIIAGASIDLSIEFMTGKYQETL